MRILIADDHGIVRGGLKLLIDRQPDMEVVAEAEDGVEVAVRGAGRGFALEGQSNGLGLNGMAERARLVGGELAIDSQPGAGTAVSLRVP